MSASSQSSMGRRSFFKRAAGVTLLSLLPIGGFAASSGVSRVRPDATSPEGKAILEKYARAVEKMRAGNQGRYDSWTFQWYTHWVTGSSDKLSELERIYGSQSDPARDLAVLMWSTCQAHFAAAEFEPNFLPWHRAYLLFFERIVQEVLGDADFVLPYWDYTSNAAIPEEFRMQGHPVFGSLFMPNRNSGVNDGVPINQIQTGMPSQFFGLSAMNELSYLPGADGVPQGLNEKLDFELHGYVHVNTGNSRNMGSVPFAANDPIFWLHHCNIDRIWAGWNAAGGANPSDPSWKETAHVFADATGSRVELKNREVSSIELLGYSYQTLPVPPSLATIAAAMPPVAAEQPPVQLAAADGPLVLGAQPALVRLEPIASDRMEILGASRPVSTRLYLVLGSIETNIQPGIVYNVFATSAGSGDQPGPYLGSIHFFDAEKIGDAPAKAVRFVFDVTDAIADANAVDPLAYTIVPAGEPNENAQPVVGSVELVAR